MNMKADVTALGIGCVELQQCSKGAFLISRSLFESAIWFAPPWYLKQWVWLIGRCNHNPKLCSGRIIERGQCLVTFSETQDALGSYMIGYRKIRPTRGEIRGCYDFLRKNTMISTMKTTRGMIVTITKYDLYQSLSSYAKHTEQHAERSPKNTITAHYKQVLEKNKELIDEVFNYFLEKTGGKFALTDERRLMIHQRLINGHAVDELKTAIDRFSKDGWEGRDSYRDIFYCLGRNTKTGVDNLEKWLNVTNKQGGAWV